jgi:ABC-type sugar transport system substrate-binding protein
MKRLECLRTLAAGVLLTSILLVPTSAVAHAQPVRAHKAYTLGAIVFGTDVFFQLVRLGMQDAAKKDNVKLLLNNSTYDASKEASVIQQYLAAHVDGIVISPVSEQTSAHNLKPAIQAGLAISCYNTCVKGVKAFVHSSDFDLGRQTGILAAKYVRSHMAGKATIGILTCDKLYAVCMARRQGFFDQLKGLQYKLVAEQQSFEATDAVNRASTILQAHPNINFLWAENEGGTVGEVRAVKTAGLAGKVVVFGTDASTQLAGFLLASDNILQATTGQDGHGIGYQAVIQAVSMLDNKTSGADIATKSIVLDRQHPGGVNAFMKVMKQYGVS